MSPALRPLFFTTALAGTLALGAGARAETFDVAMQEVSSVESVVVTGEKARSSAVTGLDLSLRETPQSVTLVTQAQISQFGLTDVNHLLTQVTGLNVEQVETDRTYYNSRGFDITNFQADGIGLPLIWGIQFGDLDTVLFDRVEVVRGANSMMTGTGNPSATVNYVRKRPTEAFQASASLQYGSWDTWRVEADVSGPLNADKTVRGRLIYAHEDGESWLDYKSVKRDVLGGVLAWDVTQKLTATAGYSLNDNRSKGVLWGALPLLASDGSRIDYPVSASTSADWTFWNVKDQTAFAELYYRFDNGWSLKGVATYKRFDELAKLLYAYGNPDPQTGLGVSGMSGIYPSEYESWIVDAYASGPFQAFGRTHTLVVGGQVSKSTGVEYEDFYAGQIDYPAVADWGRLQVAGPVYPGAYLASDQTDDQQRFYAAAHLDLSDRLKAVVGFNLLRLKSKGFSYGVDTPRDEAAVSPYLGAVFDLTGNLSLYASYTDIFNPQSEVDVNHRTLPAAHGKSYEAGIKSEWLDKRLYLTASVFQSEQSDLAEYAGAFANGKSYYRGVDTKAVGYELEAVGAINERWSLSAGWTQLDIEDGAGQDTRLYVPRKSLKLMTTYTEPRWRNLTVGAALRWQSAVEGMDLAVVRQDAYAVADLTLGVDVTDRVRATLNVRNVTDETYLSSLMWNQAFYAAPRNASLKLQFSY